MSLGSSSQLLTASARRMRKTRQQMSIYRHDLLVAMRVVNIIEQEIIRAEWEHWVLQETDQCDKAGELLLEVGRGNESFNEQRAATNDTGRDARAHLQAYCSSCKEARQQLLWA